MQPTNGEQLPGRPRRADINRHAISLTGHLLMVGVWLERRLMSVPKPRFRVETSERRALSTLVVRANDTPFELTRIEDQ
jgi:hypothetical protein